jgi:hypothetical protein
MRLTVPEKNIRPTNWLASGGWVMKGQRHACMHLQKASRMRRPAVSLGKDIDSNISATSPRDQILRAHRGCT